MKNFGNRKIYIVSPTESVLTKRGKRHPNLADYLIDKGYKVNYITSTINHASKVTFTYKEIQEVVSKVEYPIQFIDVGLYKKNIGIKRFYWNIMFAYKVFKLLNKVLKQGDVVIFPSRPPELPFIGMLLKKKHKVNLLIDIEDIWPDAFMIENKFIKSLFYCYCNMLNSISIPCFDSSVHVSPNFKTWLNRYDSNKMSVFTPLGITSEEDNPKAKKFYTKEQKTFSLFYGGTLTLQFDILPLLRAIKKSNINFSITLAGDNGTGERSQEVIDFLDNSNIEYKNYGIMDKKDFIETLAISDISILPMISGGLPKKFYDALGSYKPIICMGRGGAFDEIKKNNLGWSTTFITDDIVAVLNSINSDNLNSKIENITKYRNMYLEQHSLELMCLEIKKLNQQ
jgi:glycosyltransferase involved in cell wall biosynthesis